MRVQINKGHTNVSYRDGSKFIQEKKHNGFNHNIDYSVLNVFDFVPKLLSDNTQFSEWEFIDGVEPTISLDNVEQIAQQIKAIHNSKLVFAPSNHARRVKHYRMLMKQFNRRVEVLDKYYRSINLTLAKMAKNTPLHNDLWPFNMIETKDKIYFVDWEYATMGDKHFELAYVIEASDMNAQIESKFLQAYGNYNPVHLLRHKMLVNYLVVLWVHTQTQPPFDTHKYQQRIERYANELISITSNK